MLFEEQEFDLQREKVAAGAIFRLPVRAMSVYPQPAVDCCSAMIWTAPVRMLAEMSLNDGTALTVGPLIASLLLLVVVLLIGPHRGAAMEQAR
jgi:hypothetical protein